MIRFLWIVGFATGCVQLMEPLDERDCETRQAFFPDEDGDGLGEPTTMVFACEPPEGFVTQLAPTGDTGT
ncbi:MAG: hypothetical protein AAGA48_39170 [Myxococcota bacterium]